ASFLCTTVVLPNQAPRRAAAGAMPGGERLAIFEWGAYARYFERPVLAGRLVQFCLCGFAFTSCTSGFALFAERTFTWRAHPFTPREIGYLFAYAGFLGIILQGGLIGRLVRRFGERRLVTAGFVALAMGLWLLGVIHDVGPLVAVATVTAFGQGVLRPTLTSLLTQNAEAHEQGVVLGLAQSLSSLAQITAPALGGWLIGHALLAPWAFTAGAAATLGLVATRWGSARAAAAEAPRSAVA